MPKTPRVEIVKEEAEAAGQEMIRRGVALTSEVLSGLDPTFLMGALVREGELTLKFVAPPEHILAKLRDETKFVDEAKDFEVDGSDDFIIADQRQSNLRDDADDLESVRKGGNAGLLSMKNAWDLLYAAGVKDRLSAAAILQGKMRAYETKVKSETQISRVNAESAVETHVDKMRLEIDQLRSKAAKLKGPKKRELELEADRLERIAELTPTNISQQAPSVPRTGGSGRAALWEGTVTDPILFMCWLLQLPKIVVDTLEKDRCREEIAGIEFKQSMLNNLAKLVTDTKKIPGFKAEQQTSYRRDPKRQR